ncbi:hypothetical protein D499_0AD00440 [Hanseniaspora uvarum DSM 2768]|nr:hypothetical protein D499_0AD00440 [Hanseniaspora uvarum DSM 2768]
MTSTMVFLLYGHPLTFFNILINAFVSEIIILALFGSGSSLLVFVSFDKAVLFSVFSLSPSFSMISVDSLCAFSSVLFFGSTSFSSGRPIGSFMLIGVGYKIVAEMLSIYSLSLSLKKDCCNGSKNTAASLLLNCIVGIRSVFFLLFFVTVSLDDTPVASGSTNSSSSFPESS